jgi:hypothetical protein
MKRWIPEIVMYTCALVWLWNIWRAWTLKRSIQRYFDLVKQANEIVESAEHATTVNELESAREQYEAVMAKAREELK